MPLGKPLKSQPSGLAKEGACQDAPYDAASSNQQDNLLVQLSEQQHPQLPT